VLAALLTVSVVGAAWAESPQEEQNITRCNDPTDPDIRISGCTAVIQSGGGTRRRWLQSARSKNEFLAFAFNNRSVAYHAKGQYDRAIQDYDEAIRLKPDYANAFDSRGNSYRHMGQYDSAIQDYDQAIRLKPDNAKAFNNRGAAYDGKGQYDRAIQDYAQAIRLKPDYAPAFNNRGQSRYYLEQFAPAATDFVRGLALNPSSAYAVLWLHLARSKIGARDADELSRNAATLDLGKWPGRVI
jgi:tetratricopeptide (TPR) repeat protein